MTRLDLIVTRGVEDSDLKAITAVVKAARVLIGELDSGDDDGLYDALVSIRAAMAPLLEEVR
jgi:hypothetical protein